MEQQVFVKPAVAEILGDNYIEARLHTDYPRFMKLEEDLLNTKSQPVFAVASPDQWENLANFDQEDFDPSKVELVEKLPDFTYVELDVWVEMIKRGSAR